MSRQSHSVSARLGWRKPRWSYNRSSSNFECRRADSDRYDTLDFRQILWNAVRITLICITQSSPCTLRFALTMVVVFIHDVYRNYFTKEALLAIISSKVVSHKSVFVTFDLIIFTKILEYKRRWDRRCRKEVRQDSETRQRNSVKVICAKCRLTSSKSRVPKERRSDSTDDPSNYIDWIIFTEIRWDDPVDDFHQYIVNFLCLVDYAFFLSFIFSSSK